MKTIYAKFVCVGADILCASVIDDDSGFTPLLNDVPCENSQPSPELAIEALEEEIEGRFEADRSSNGLTQLQAAVSTGFVPVATLDPDGIPAIVLGKGVRFVDIGLRFKTFDLAKHALSQVKASSRRATTLPRV